MNASANPDTAAGERTGFALGLVVFFLFAIGMAAAAGYQVVFLESALASSAMDGQKALVAARAGLRRYLGEQIGVVGDTVAYAIGDGVATVTARKLYEADEYNHMYYLRSEAEVTDPRYPDTPARRTVGTYAWHRIAPISQRAAIIMTEGRLDVDNWFGSIFAEVYGWDSSTGAECTGGGTYDVAAVATSGNVRDRGGDYDGNPAEETFYADFQEVYDTVGIRWDILTDPNFPVEFDGSPPDFGSLPADSFPIVRKIGNLSANWTWSGRGVLIVTGDFTPNIGFNWDGIVLAGELRRVRGWYGPVIDGMLIAGMNDSQGNVRLDSGDYNYHYCNALAANRSLAYLEPLPNAVFEAN